MIGRRQLAVSSPVSAAAVARAVSRAVAATAGSSNELVARARSLVAREFSSDATLLTDSGTSALALALKIAVPYGGVVGYPGYACVDLSAAARFAGVRVRLYDLDPDTLNPDLASVERMLHRGVDAIVVAHLFGFPMDVDAVRALAERTGVTVIEDAAQGAGGTLCGRRLGSLGELSVLSFGRGKGLCAAGGGALLGRGARRTNDVNELRLASPPRGLAGLAKTGVQWALGRPSVYALPAAIPWLRLGEMVYHPAHEPAPMSLGSNALLASALALEPHDLAARRRNADALDTLAARAPGFARIRPIDGADPGYLRYPIRDLSGRARADRALGIVQPYREPLVDQAPLVPILIDERTETPAAVALSRSLFTLPTHAHVTDTDVERLGRWLEASGG